MQVSISSITIPPRIPGDLHQKFGPSWGFCILAFAGGGGERGFVGIVHEGQAFKFVFKRFLPFLEFPRTGD